MPKKLYVAGSWLYYNDPSLDNESPYKLHIALPIEHFEQNWQKVDAMLKKAADAGVIKGFKVINWGHQEAIKRILPSSQLSYQQNKYARVGNNPFTIYLFDETEINGIKKLIKEIDNMLQQANIPGVNPSHLSAADLPLKLSSHFSLRQASLDGDYVALSGATAEEFQRLKQEVMGSGVYQALNEGQDSAIDIKPNDAENIAFYNQNYNRLEAGLNSKDINIQFNHAAWLLGIDIADFKKTQNVDISLEKIKKAYFRLSLKYHPDKSGDQAKTVANKMTQLLNKSRDLLNEVAKNIQLLLDTKDILAQVPYAPKYQYELDTFEEDPYFYIDMAKSSKIFILKENWIVAPVETTLNNSLVVYSQNVSVHEIAKNIRIPGWQAFWLLFKAGALPRRFDQEHLDTALEGCDAELIKNMLTDKFSLLWLDSYDVFSLAKKATKDNIVKMGLTDEDVFIYFYTHHPETLYGNRINKIINKGAEFKITKINKNIIEEAILKNKENLSRLGRDGLDEIAKNFPKVKEYIFSRKDLCLHFSSHYWHYECTSLRKPNLPMLSSNEWKPWCAMNLMDGRIDFLRFLSPDSIKELKSYLIGNGIYEFS